MLAHKTKLLKWHWYTMHAAPCACHMIHNTYRYITSSSNPVKVLAAKENLWFGIMWIQYTFPNKSRPSKNPLLLWRCRQTMSTVPELFAHLFAKFLLPRNTEQQSELCSIWSSYPCYYRYLFNHSKVW